MAAGGGETAIVSRRVGLARAGEARRGAAGHMVGSAVLRRVLLVVFGRVGALWVGSRAGEDSGRFGLGNKVRVRVRVRVLRRATLHSTARRALLALTPTPNEHLRLLSLPN